MLALGPVAVKEESLFNFSVGRIPSQALGPGAVREESLFSFRASAAAISEPGKDLNGSRDHGAEP